jgi:Tol biopolymer transport system component
MIGLMHMHLPGQDQDDQRRISQIQETLRVVYCDTIWGLDGRRRALHLLDWKKDHTVRVLTSKEFYVDSYTISPSGRWIVFYARKRDKRGIYPNPARLHLLDLEGFKIRELKIASDEGYLPRLFERYFPCSFLRNDKIVAISKKRRRLFVFDPAEETAEEHKLTANLSRLSMMDVCGQKIVLAIKGRTRIPYSLVVYDLKTKKEKTIRTFPVGRYGPVDNWVGCIRFSPDGRYIGFTTTSRLQIYDLKEAKYRRICWIGSRQGGYRKIVWSSDSTKIVLSGGGKLRVFNLRRKCIREVNGYFNALPCWSPDGRYLAVAGRIIIDEVIVDGEKQEDYDGFGLLLIDFEKNSAKIIQEFDSAHTIAQPTFTPDGSFIILPVKEGIGYTLYAFDISGEQKLALTDDETLVFRARVGGLPGNLLRMAFLSKK